MEWNSSSKYFSLIPSLGGFQPPPSHQVIYQKIVPDLYRED